MKRGTLVKYVGDTVPALKNRCGRFVRTNRNGWLVVDFGEGYNALPCAAFNIKRIESDPHAIARKWVRVLGLGFHPDTRGADYDPPLSPDEIREYDADMETLFSIEGDPYECGLSAMQAAGLIEGEA